MKVPADLLQMLCRFVAENYESTGLLSSPSEVGIACQQIGAEWCMAHEGRLKLEGIDSDSLASWCGRYGKHVGSFYILERSRE